MGEDGKEMRKSPAVVAVAARWKEGMGTGWDGVWGPSGSTAEAGAEQKRTGKPWLNDGLLTDLELLERTRLRLFGQEGNAKRAREMMMMAVMYF